MNLILRGGSLGLYLDAEELHCREAGIRGMRSLSQNNEIYSKSGLEQFAILDMYTTEAHCNTRSTTEALAVFGCSAILG